MNNVIKILLFSVSVLMPIWLSAQTNLLDVEGDTNIDGDLYANGDVVISDLGLAAGHAILVDNTGKLIAYEPKFTTLDLLGNGQNTIGFTDWDPVGVAKTFTKHYNHTIIDAQLNESVYWSGGANTVRLRVQILNETLSNSIAGQSSNSVTWEHVTSHSIYDNLPAGTYTAQVFARSIGGTTIQVSLRSDVFGGGIWIEEKL